MAGADEIREQIGNLSGHPGIRLIQQGLGLLLDDTTMTPAQTQMVLGDLAVFDDGNVAGIVSALVEHLTGPDRAGLQSLPEHQRVDAQKLGAEYAALTNELSQHQLASDAIAALDMPEGR